MKIAENVIELIGGTPLVKINKLNPNKNVLIYAKLEGYNPGGSVKDRVCMKMIDEAEKKGMLTKDKVIIEPTSGNTGIGLAMIAAFKGYKCLLIMPASVSMEKVLLLKAFGAKVILTPPQEGVDGAIRLARKILIEDSKETLSEKDLRGPVSTKNYFMPNQFDNPANPKVHYDTTGREIWEQTEGKITHFIAGLGTSGTMMGVGKFLKEKNPSIKLIGVEPERDHRIQGLKNMSEAIRPKIFDETLLDMKIIVSTEEAYKWALKITKEEGIFAGQSSGAAMYAAAKVAKEVNAGLFVVIFPDFGFKYLFTDPYFDEEVAVSYTHLTLPTN